METDALDKLDSNISFIHTIKIKIKDPVFEYWAIHPTLLLCDVLAGQMVKIYKMARVFLFGYNEHGELFSLSICCRHSGYSLLFFPPEHFSPLRFVLILTVKGKWLSMYNRNLHDCIYISTSVLLRFGHLCNRKTRQP